MIVKNRLIPRPTLGSVDKNRKGIPQRGTPPKNLLMVQRINTAGTETKT